MKETLIQIINGYIENRYNNETTREALKNAINDAVSSINLNQTQNTSPDLMNNTNVISTSPDSTP